MSKIDPTDSDTRRKGIFRAIVETYISTASPVGSELISKKLRSILSPATIRNIMGELEAEGFLEQPHTSAGRVPTDHGYRYYVDGVMDARHLSPEELRELEAQIEPEELEIEQVLARASAILAELTQCAACVLVPTVKQSRVKQIELVPLSVKRLLCVMVANQEIVASHVVEVEEPMSRDEATALVRFLNTELVGLPFNELLSSLERRLLAERDSFYHLVKRSLTILQHALSTEPDQRLFLEGTSYLVSQPEFAKDTQRAHQMLKLLDHEDELIRYLLQDVSADGVQVRIGRETQLPALEGCSSVTAPFAIGDQVVGTLGIMGPRRMDYRTVCALVEGTARSVTHVLTHWHHE